MTARDVTVHGMALGEVLSAIDRNITTLERRISWPGATHTTSGGPWGAYAANVGQVNVLSLTLDPGRWVIFSSMSISLTATDPFDYPPGGELVTRLQASNPLIIGDRQLSLTTGIYGTMNSAMTNVLDITSDTPVTVRTYGAANYELVGWVGPTGTFVITSAILIAFPG